MEELAEQQSSGVEREPPQTSEAETKLVKQWCEDIENAKRHWEDDFKRMRDDAKFERGLQWENQRAKDDRYIANLTKSHIRSKVAALYAKNPKVQARRRPKIYYQAWDGSPEMLQQAQLTLAAMQNPAGAQAAIAAGQAPQPTMDPETATLVMRDHEQGRAMKAVYDKMGRTLEIVAQYSLDEPIPKFKTRAKQLVRRTSICGVGYVKLGYQRLLNRSPDLMGRIKDSTDRLEHLKRIRDDLTDDKLDVADAEAAELELNLASLQKEAEVIIREGLVFDFPKAWSIIIDPACTEIKGFIGAGWVAQEFIFTPKKAQEIWGVDVSSSFTPHSAEGRRIAATSKAQKLAAFYEVYDLTGQVCFTLCLGYPGFIKAPGEPDVWLEQFHPFYQLTFNDVEDDESIYPPSDVSLLRPMQVEYNRSREALRQHRIANRPAWVAVKGLFGEHTKERFGNHVDHEVIEHDLPRDVDLSKALREKPKAPIDPAVYETEHLYADMMRAGGRQAANLGGTSGATATEVTVAEQSRSDGDSSNVDDLDEFLTDVMRGAGQILLLNMSEQTAKEIAGPGAVWPQQSKKEVARELCLEVRAGSSGRPNRQARLLAIEKTAPFLLQTPGFKPKKLGELILMEVDETLDIEEFYEDGQPSIVAMNAAKNAIGGVGAGGDAPMAALQGGQGGMNAPQAAESGARTQNLGGAGGGAPNPLTVQ